MKIIRNKIRRKKYGDIIESVSAHDYETCSCGARSVDGGHYYLKRSAASPDDYEELRHRKTSNVQSAANFQVIDTKKPLEHEQSNRGRNQQLAGFIFQKLFCGMAL